MGIGQIHHEFGVGRSRDAGDFIAGHRRHGLNPEILGNAVDGHPQMERFVIHIRRAFQTVNANFRHRLQPDRLPDAGSRGVKNPVRFERLFAARLIAFRGIGHTDGNLLRALPNQGVRDVEREGVVPSLMLSDGMTVHPHLAMPVHRPEMQSDLLSAPRFRRRKSSAIPELAVVVELGHHAGKRGFHGKGDQNFSRRRRRRIRGRVRGDRVIPKAVQIQPIRSRQLRAGIFRVNMVGIHAGRPARARALLVLGERGGLSRGPRDGLGRHA